MKVKEESEKVGLKLNIQKTKVMASSPITSWQIDGETVTDFIFSGSQITADGDCSHEIKRCLLLGKKVMTDLHSILKSRDITLPAKVHLVKAMIFPVVMYGCECWTTKKAERRRIDAFELWWWRRLLRVPWTARRSNQFILKEINPGISLEGMMLKLKLQYFGHLMHRTDSFERPWCWERLRAGWEGDDRGWDGCMASPTQWTWVCVNSGSWWWTGRPGVLQSMVLQRAVTESDMTEQLNWTELFYKAFFISERRSWFGNLQNSRISSRDLLRPEERSADPAHTDPQQPCPPAIALRLLTKSPWVGTQSLKACVRCGPLCLAKQ